MGPQMARRTRMRGRDGSRMSISDHRGEGADIGISDLGFRISAPIAASLNLAVGDVQNDHQGLLTGDGKHDEEYTAKTRG